MPNDQESLEHSELLNRKSILSNDMKLLKNHQWQTTYYSLLLSAAIIGLLKLDPLFLNGNDIATLLAAYTISLIQFALVLLLQLSFARAWGPTGIMLKSSRTC